MPRTQNDLVARVLRLVNALASGQTPAAEDADTVIDALPGVVAELEAIEILYLPDMNSIPDAVFEPLAIFVADAVGPDFGIARSADTRADAEARLQKVNADTYSGGVLATVYF